MIFQIAFCESSVSTQELSDFFCKSLRGKSAASFTWREIDFVCNLVAQLVGIPKRLRTLSIFHSFAQRSPGEIPGLQDRIKNLVALQHLIFGCKLVQFSQVALNLGNKLPGQFSFPENDQQQNQQIKSQEGSNEDWETFHHFQFCQQSRMMKMEFSNQPPPT